MKMYGFCAGCKREKWWVRQRTYFLPQLNKAITSNGELCKTCFINIKNATLPQ